MEKHMQDKSELKTDDISGENLDKGKHADESLNEKKLDIEDQPESTLNTTDGGTIVGDSSKANIETGMNEEKSTVSNTDAPSSSVSEK